MRKNSMHIVLRESIEYNFVTHFFLSLISFCHSFLFHVGHSKSSRERMGGVGWDHVISLYDEGPPYMVGVSPYLSSCLLQSSGVFKYFISDFLGIEQVYCV